MRRALPDDMPLLMSLMTEFYAESGYELNRPLVAGAFAALLADARLGYVWLIQENGEDVGYLVVTIRFGMEYAGLMACLDDLYVIPSHRNSGLSTAALMQVRGFCEESGIRALTVEVGHGNGPAQTVYRRVGFVEAADRQLLALALANPAHAV